MYVPSGFVWFMVITWREAGIFLKVIPCDILKLFLFQTVFMVECLPWAAGSYAATHYDVSLASARPYSWNTSRNIVASFMKFHIGGILLQSVDIVRFWLKAVNNYRQFTWITTGLVKKNVSNKSGKENWNTCCMPKNETRVVCPKLKHALYAQNWNTRMPKI